MSILYFHVCVKNKIMIIDFLCLNSFSHNNDYILTGLSQIRLKNTLWGLHKRGPYIKLRKRKNPLDGNPFMKGVIIKTLIKKPKKPNSANRKCVLVRLSNGKEMFAYVPGMTS